MSSSFLTQWTIACHVPLSMEFPRQEHWSGSPFPSSGDPPDTAVEPESTVSPALQADSLLLSHRRSPLIKYTEHEALCSALLLIVKTLTLDVQQRGTWCLSVLLLYFSLESLHS